MKKIIIITIMALSTWGITTLTAGEHHGHDHKGHAHNQDKAHKHGPRQEGDSHHIMEVKENIDSIEKNAKKEVQKLVLEKKIPKSWASVEMKKIEKTENNTDDWVVSFNNIKIKDKLKQTLYVFVSAYGKVVGGNYTGK